MKPDKNCYFKTLACNMVNHAKRFVIFQVIISFFLPAVLNYYLEGATFAIFFPAQPRPPSFAKLFPRDL